MNIRLLTLAEVTSVEGEAGDFRVTVLQHPRYVDTDKCIACGVCAEKCPRKVPNEYDEGLGLRKAIYVKYPQAFPLKYVIDPEHCIYFLKGTCRACEKFCPSGAISFDDREHEVSFRVGGVILSTGCRAYDPSAHDLYGYGSCPDILTSLEFERMLSASGPFGGRVLRPSTGQAPRRIAWLQCVGSRDEHLSRGYCSSVCCTYAVKEAMMAKEHVGGALDTAVFYMDIRTHGKDFERYLDRGRHEAGIRFVKTRVSSVALTSGGNPCIRYVDHAGRRVEEPFDMVVLSTGLEVPPDTVALAGRLGIELDSYRFAVTDGFQPVSTSRPGVFVCGTLEGPKDIPSSIVQASAAAGLAGTELAAGRWSLTTRKEVPDEIRVTGEPPRIGVFVCNCGTNIGGVVDVPELTRYASTLPGVVHAEHNLFSCSQDNQEKMKQAFLEHRINRVVVAACSPKTHEALFQESLQACGLNKFLLEMANIRNQDSWVHSERPAAATGKAKDLVRMSVARAALLTPLREKKISIRTRALVIGGGVSGMTAALGLADQGFEVVLLEKEHALGGLAGTVHRTIDGSEVGPYLDGLITRVDEHDGIQVLTDTLVVHFGGFKGNFTTEVLVGPAMYEREIEHGVVILATGAGEYQPEEYRYGEDDRVVTQLELTGTLERTGAADLRDVVMIQCVGSRTNEYPNCSRVCCQTAVKNALRIKELSPGTRVYVLHRDIRTYGLLEGYYRRAREQGVVFLRFDESSPPVVGDAAGGLRVTFEDPVLHRELVLPADLVALSAGVRPEDTEELASILKLERNRDGFFMEAHVKLRPVDMANDGVFVCGTAHSPQLIGESISQAMAAVSRAATFLSQSEISLSAVTARVDGERCAACLVCVRVCPYEVPRINREGVSEIDEALCRGCGICAAECPAKAIELNWYEDPQILCKIDSLLEGVV